MRCKVAKIEKGKAYFLVQKGKFFTWDEEKSSLFDTKTGKSLCHKFNGILLSERNNLITTTKVPKDIPKGKVEVILHAAGVPALHEQTENKHVKKSYFFETRK